MIIMVVAMDKHRLIGDKNHLPWHCADDLKHFHALVRGQAMLIGRKTLESLPSCLRNEHLYVATHHDMEESASVHVCTELKDVLNTWKRKQEHLYICGGAQIYAQAFPYVDEIWLSLIEGEYDGDTYLPDFDYTCFQDCVEEQREGFILYHYFHRKDDDGCGL